MIGLDVSFTNYLLRCVGGMSCVLKFIGNFLDNDQFIDITNISIIK